MTKFTATADLNSCKIENPSCLFRPQAQYLGSNKWRFWALAWHICITCIVKL